MCIRDRRVDCLNVAVVLWVLPGNSGDARGADERIGTGRDVSAC